jgi:prepilin peptidase CpaA
MYEAYALVPTLQPALLALAVVLLGIASLNDIAVRTIPDLASLGLIAIGIAIRLADGSAPTALVASIAVFLFGAFCWRFGWLGGGDVKLLAACALLVSPALVPRLVLLTAIAGGMLACLYLVLSAVARVSLAPTAAVRPHSFLGRVRRAEWWRISRRASLPYGCAIAVATVITLSGR